MHISAEPIDPCQVRLTIMVPSERLERSRREVAQEIARRHRFPGYRPGKVPYARIVEAVGEEALNEEAQERAVKDSVLEAIRQEGLVPVTPVEIEDLSQHPLTVRILVSLQPEVELGDYHALRLPPAEPEPVTDEDVEGVIEEMRVSLAERGPLDRPAAAGDDLSLDIAGQLGEREVYRREALQLRLQADAALAAGLPPAAVESLTGARPGDRIRFQAAYSELWPDAALQGQTVDFEASVLALEGATSPPLDDTLAEKLGAESLEDLRAKLRERLEARSAAIARDRELDRALRQLVAGATVRFPPALLDEEVAARAQALREQVEAQGFTWERWLTLQPKGEAEILAEIEAYAEAQIRNFHVITAFARAEGIQIGRKELDANVELVRRTKRELGMEQDQRDALRRELGLRMLVQRISERLLEIAEGEPAPAAAPAATPTEEA